MRNQAQKSAERLQSLQIIAAFVASIMGIVALFDAVRAAIGVGNLAAGWTDFAISLLAALGALAVVPLARKGHDELASWLLVTATAVRIILAATVTAPQQFMLLWPLFIVPVMIAQILLGSRTGFLASLGAIPLFVFGYFALAEYPDIVARLPLAIMGNVFLYLVLGFMVHVALQRMTGAVRQAQQVVSSHERARTELREREEQFRALAESSATGIVIHQDGRLVYGNPHFFETVRSPSSDGFGLSLWDFFDETAEQELQAQLTRRRTLKRAVEPSLVLLKPLKGRPRWCEVALADAMFWQKPAIVANLLDVTERVQAQLEVQRERDFSNNIIDTAEALIMAVDANGHVVRFNPAAQQITGYTSEELRGRPFWEIFPPSEMQEETQEIFQEIAGGSRRGSRELVWQSKAGEELTISWHYVGQYDDAGGLTGMVAIGIDVTQQRILERQAMITERLRSLGQIAGGVAHDLNNMLAGIIGPADLLLLEEEDPEKQRALNGILAAATRGAETVRRIQSFSKARTDLDKQVFDLREMAEDIIFSLRPRWRDAAQKQGIRINLRNQVPKGLTVHASAGEIGNVMMNLIVNACEAMPHDGEIVVDGKQKDDFIQFTVTDTGSGMSPETMENIFKPFFSTKGADNSGLGLAVIHGIILRHGGTISVDSELGRGTTFTITLPGERPKTESATPTGGLETHAAQLRILVVDDVPDIADYIGTVARRCGHEADVSYSGEEALVHLQATQYDVLITDYGMEGISGVDLGEKARQLQPGIRMVMVTGWDVTLEELEGFDGLLKKPCTREQIENMLRTLLQPAA